jgi:hypothetical protein
MVRVKAGSTIKDSTNANAKLGRLAPNRASNSGNGRCSHRANTVVITSVQNPGIVPGATHQWYRTNPAAHGTNARHRTPVGSKSARSPRRPRRRTK